MAKSSSLLLLLFTVAIVPTLAQNPPPPPPSPPPPPPSPPPPPPSCRFNSCPQGQVCQNGVCVPVCFPGDATVQLFDGRTKPMSELAIGDKVLAGRSKDRLVYSEVYAFGHRILDARTDFIRVHVGKGSQAHQLELSELHFAPVFSGKDEQVINKRAKDLVVGEQMLVVYRNSSSLVTIREISVVEKQGLFNPFTLTGTIVVNGVLASAHSEWFLDKLFERFGWVERLPSTYQFIMFPARALYSLVGAHTYKVGYEIVDQWFDIAQMGSRYATHFALAFAVATMATTKVLSKKMLDRLDSSKMY